jgi:protein transport protein SEC24
MTNTPQVVATLKEFRLLHANLLRGPTNRLIFPETMRYLPLFALGIMKTAALR